MRTTLLLLSLAACHDFDDPNALVPATVDQDPSLPSIRLEQGELPATLIHSEAFGDPAAPLVIALHGGPGCDYRSILPLAALADDGYRVVFWDQRGTGLSQRHDADSYTLDGYLDDLRLIVDHYTVSADQPVMFIGHSWGAIYATGFINAHGDYGGRLRGAVLSEPGAFNKQQLDEINDRQNGEIPLTSEQLNDALWSRQFMSAADHARADYLQALLAFEGRPSEHHDPNNPPPFWRFGAVVSGQLIKLVDEHGFDFTTNLGAFPHKVQFIRGGLNENASLEQQQLLASFYPNAEVLTMEPATGHELIWEGSEHYLALTRAYFQEIGFTP